MMVCYHSVAYCALVNKETHEPYFVHELFEHDYVSWFGKQPFEQLVENLEFHYGAKMLRDSNRDPSIKAIIRENNYYVDILMTRVDERER